MIIVLIFCKLEKLLRKMISVFLMVILYFFFLADCDSRNKYKYIYNAKSYKKDYVINLYTSFVWIYIYIWKIDFSFIVSKIIKVLIFIGTSCIVGMVL